MTDARPRVVILGGGIAGLSAAWECHRQGLRATVLEAESRAGGVIRTDREGPFVLDTGPDSFLISKPGAIALCRELGIDGQLISMKTPRDAWVLREGRLHALPEGGAFGIPTRVAPLLRSTLLSPAGKLRVAIEPVVPCRRAREDESVGAFFRRRFGHQLTNHIAQPLLGGIHVGDIDRLSAEAVVPQLAAAERAGRSVLLTLRSQRRSVVDGGPFRSFPGGMETLVEALLAQLPPDTVRLGCPATALRRDAETWRIGTMGADELAADIVLLAAPAAVVANWLQTVDQTAAHLSGNITSVSSAGILAVYRDDQVATPLRGSGYVATPQPGAEPLLATSWLTGKWAGRAPAGYTILRGFVGGAFDQSALARPDAALVDDAHRSWSARFGISGTPALARVVRWERASPQHEVGHGARVRQLDGRLAALPGIAVAGSGFRAVGIPDVVADARHAIRTLLEQWGHDKMPPA